MLNEQQAKELAEAYLAKRWINPNDTFVFLDDRTRRGDWGWMFLFQSKRYMETRKFSDQLIGNSPIIVSKDGKIYRGGTAYPVEYYIEEFKKGNLQPEE